MKRRIATQNILTTLGLLSVAPLARASNRGEGAKSKYIGQNIVKPARLKKGQKVGLIAPGSAIEAEALKKAIKNLKALGLEVELGEHVRAKHGYIAGTDKERLSDLHMMFRRRDIDAIWCARGGYGCTRLLPDLDYDLIKSNPKLLIGYSDITALLNGIFEKTGLVGIHGPVGASEQTEYTKEHFVKVAMKPNKQFKIELSAENQEKEDPAFDVYAIQPGKAEGILVGGNLSLLAAMAGTEYQPEVKDRLVFIEDVGEKPYRIDRMLTQLRQAYALEEAAGLALGVFADCEPDEDDASLSLKECLHDRLGDLGIPVMYGFSFGHIGNQCSFPVGVRAHMDTTKKTITLLEAAVQ